MVEVGALHRGLAVVARLEGGQVGLLGLASGGGGSEEKNAELYVFNIMHVFLGKYFPHEKGSG